jgi:hypothetical protein
MERDLINQLERAHEVLLGRLRDLERFYSDATVNPAVKEFILTFLSNFEEVEDPFVVLRSIHASGLHTIDVGDYITEQFDDSCACRLKRRRVMTFKVLNTCNTQAIVLEHDDTLKIHNIEFEDVCVD